LSALTGTGFSDDDGDGVVLDGFDDFIFVLDNGKGCHPHSVFRQGILMKKSNILRELK
jgi:hypothetical protein